MRPERQRPECRDSPGSCQRRGDPRLFISEVPARPVVHAVVNCLEMVRRSPTRNQSPNTVTTTDRRCGCDPVFPDEDSLPGPQLAAAFIDRDAKGGLSEDRPDVRGHVVGTFEVVDELRIAVRHQPRGEVFEIPPYGRVGVLADDQRRTGVLDEDVAQSASIPDRRDDLLDLPGDLVGRPAAAGLDRQSLTVEPCSRNLHAITCRERVQVPCRVGRRLNRT